MQDKRKPLYYIIQHGKRHSIFDSTELLEYPKEKDAIIVLTPESVKSGIKKTKAMLEKYKRV